MCVSFDDPHRQISNSFTGRFTSRFHLSADSRPTFLIFITDYGLFNEIFTIISTGLKFNLVFYHYNQIKCRTILITIDVKMLGDILLSL